MLVGAIAAPVAFTLLCLLGAALAVFQLRRRAQYRLLWGSVIAPGLGPGTTLLVGLDLWLRLSCCICCAKKGECC